MFFCETTCQFHSIEGNRGNVHFLLLASREPAQPGQAGLDADGCPSGAYTSHPAAGPRCTAADLRNAPCLQLARDLAHVHPAAADANGGFGLDADGRRQAARCQPPGPFGTHNKPRHRPGPGDPDTRAGPGRFPNCHCTGPCCGMARHLCCAPHNEAARQWGCYLGDVRSFYVCMN